VEQAFDLSALFRTDACPTPSTGIPVILTAGAKARHFCL